MRGRRAGVRGRRAGFTLLEVLGVVLLTGLVLGMAINFYVDLSNASNRAAAHTRDIRRATAVLDRVARDFEETVLVKKPPEVDPLAHPWLFYAESEYVESGSDRIKFVTRHHKARRSEAHESDLALVAYTVEPAEGGESYQLWRWSSTQLPESLDRSFPRADDEGSVLMAEGLSAFAVAFVGEDGEVQETWDSTTLLASSELPMAVEIAVAMADPELAPDAEPLLYTRRVALPVRPLDLQVLLGTSALGDDGEAAEEDEDGDGEPDGDENGEPEFLTLGDCVDLNAVNALDSSIPGLDVLISLVSANAGSPWANWADSVPPELMGFIMPACR